MVELEPNWCESSQKFFFAMSDRKWDTEPENQSKELDRQNSPCPVCFPIDGTARRLRLLH